MFKHEKIVWMIDMRKINDIQNRNDCINVINFISNRCVFYDSNNFKTNDLIDEQTRKCSMKKDCVHDNDDVHVEKHLFASIDRKSLKFQNIEI